MPPETSREKRTPQPSAEAIPHDQLLKTLLETFFWEFLEILDPRLAKKVEPASLEPLDREFFTDLPKGRRRQLDLLMRARLRQGRHQLFLVHVEIERNFRRRHAQRMVRYFFQLKGRYPDEPILPIVLYLKGGTEAHQVVEWSEDAAGFQTFHFRFHALALSHQLAEDHIARPTPLGWALAALMISKRWDRVEHKIECLRRLADADLDEARRFLLLNIIETYLDLTKQDQQRYNRELAHQPNEEVKAMQLTWEQKHYFRGREEGLSEGREEGIAEGREEGRIVGSKETLIRQIEHRLGPLSKGWRRRIDAIVDRETLEDLATRLLDASSLDDLGLDDG